MNRKVEYLGVALISKGEEDREIGKIVEGLQSGRDVNIEFKSEIRDQPK